MGFEGGTWHVSSIGEPVGAPVGHIVVDDGDFPWLSGRFTAGPAFAAVRDLFARELALSQREDEGRRDEWEAVYDEIRRRVSLSSPEGPVADFLLHIEGDRAWFRWIDG
ncbi:hypothetical protein [Streptomyces chromofuscus]|uniref:Uncharacterized protein n=1 Tax=Streptomyces chromofuscus TaxID=42881 RepID=A0A7M2TKU9_STRCW|nr:hypothetical protein [Streptomyces chromofuscus]QOV47891.1 hypothetical protein IPT68_33450 [Streptomyces chromofuscus]